MDILSIIIAYLTKLLRCLNKSSVQRSNSNSVSFIYNEITYTHVCRVYIYMCKYIHIYH